MIGEKKKNYIYIGSDHAGFRMKETLKQHLIDQNYEVTDLGCFSEEPCDYPDMAREVSEKVVERAGSTGILLCGTGIGMSMAANKIRGIRAVTAMDEQMAEMSKKHNNANVLSLGARVINEEKAKSITEKFLNTAFEENEERHVRRVNKIDSL